MFQIYRLLLQGQVDKVRQLLSHNPAARTDAFTSMDDCLRRMPFYNVSNVCDVCRNSFTKLFNQVIGV